MDKIKNRENSGVSVHDNPVNNLRFADDIDIIEQSNEKLQDTVDKLHTESERSIWNAYKCSKDKDVGLWKKTEENEAKVNRPYRRTSKSLYIWKRVYMG